MDIYEILRLKIRRKYIDLTYKKRRKKLKYKNFTIISNNCWGGLIYQSYGLQYNTPTIGLYFMADDYIKFVSNLKNYISKELVFINPLESKAHKLKNAEITFPVAKLDDIEIYFMHYKSEEEAKEKWTRRCKRINWNKIIYKFSNQNLCSQDLMEKFMELPLENKICFTNEKNNIDDVIYIKQYIKSKDIKASYEPFGNSKYININNYLNKLGD